MMPGSDPGNGQESPAWVHECIVAIMLENQGRQRPLDAFCKCANVLRRLALLSGNADLQHLLESWLDLEDDGMDYPDGKTMRFEEPIRLYNQLIIAIKDGTYITGQGNIGDEEFSPAHPKYVECRLTKAGLQIALSMGGKQERRPAP